MTLFTIGAARSTLVRHPWWRNGLEMLLTGGAAGAVSYFAGAWVSQFVH